MLEEVVLLATGPDRPGVMDDLSQFLLEFGANIADSRATHLRGHFTLMLLVRAEPQDVAKLRDAIPRLNERQIEAKLEPPKAAAPQAGSTFPFKFVASGADQAGVLHRITSLLTSLKINIDDIDIDVSPAESSFQMRLDLAVPRETPITMLRDYLSFLCKELSIEGSLSEA